MVGDISFDLVEEKDMEFDEGCYRVANGDWHVFIINKQKINEFQIIPSSWASGSSGVVIHIPVSMQLNRTMTKILLGDWLCVETWNEVNGPDSMDLR